jgi:PAS domain S-box-containing protein
MEEGTKRGPFSSREDFFRLLVENSLDLVVVLDGEGRVGFISPSVKRLLGYEEGELLGRNIMDFIHPDDRKSSASNLELALKRPGVTQYSLQRIRHKDGTWRHHEASALNLLDDPRVRGLVINSRDVTERMNMEKELGESRREMATLLSNLPGMAYRCRNEPQWTMLFVSEGCRELTGYAPEDLRENAAVSYAALIHPQDRDRVWREVQEALQRGEPFQLIYRIRTASGERKWVWEQGRGVLSEAGELLYLQGFITDITERVWAERVTRLQRDLAIAAASAMRLDDFMDRAVRIVIQIGEIDCCAVYLEEGEGGYRLVNHYGYTGDLLLKAVFIAADARLVELLSRGEVLYDAWGDLCREAGFQSGEELEAAVVAPLLWRGGWWGAFWLEPVKGGYRRERWSS